MESHVQTDACGRPAPTVSPQRERAAISHSRRHAALSRAQRPLAFRSSLAWRSSSAALIAWSVIATTAVRSLSALLHRLAQLGCIGYCLRLGDL